MSQKHHRLDDHGREIPDDTPITINVARRKISKFDDVRDFIRSELSNASRNAGAESFDEANDFDIPEDPAMNSPWEYSADQEAEDLEAIQRGAQALRRKKNAERSRQDQSTYNDGSASSGTKPPPAPAPAPQPAAPPAPPRGQ